MELRQHSILRISDEKTLELIELYEKEECLWNTLTPDYKSRHKRQLAAERIAKKLGIEHFTSRFVIIKFKNLRNFYCQELKKMATSVKNGDRPTYQPKVFWFDKMDSFVRPHLQRLQHTTARRPRRSAMEPIQKKHNVTNKVIVKIEPPDPLEGPSQASREEEQSSVSEHEMSLNFPDEFSEYGSEKEDPQEPLKRPSLIPSVANTPTRSKYEEIHHTRRRNEELHQTTSRNEELHHTKSRNEQLHNTIGRKEETQLPGVDAKELARLMKDISSHLHVMTAQDNNCFDSFGKYVASMLKTMPYQRAMVVQPRIMDLLIEAAVMDERRQ